jgi:hypothetical protein
VKEGRDLVPIALDDKIECVSIFAANQVLEAAVRALCRPVRVAVEDMAEKAGLAE